MALTIANFKAVKFSNLRGGIADITFGDSYPTGGEALTPGQLGLSVIDFLVAENAGGYLFEYDRANKKLRVLTPTGAVDNHTHVFTGEAMSIAPTLIDGAEPATKLLQNDAGTLKATDATAIPLGTPAGTNAAAGAASAAAAAEVGDATDLSDVTVRVFAVGW